MFRGGVVPILWLFLLAGCVISPNLHGGNNANNGNNGGNNGGANSGQGKLYVTNQTPGSNQTTGSVVRFDNALAASGNVSPNATISGTATGLGSPQYLALDPRANRLFVANQGGTAGSAILVFDNISTLNGNAAFSRSISGPLSTPTDVALDTVRDLLYVLDQNSILVFASASTLNTANATVTHTLTLSFMGAPVFVAAIFLDADNDRLYVADATNQAIQILDHASQLANQITANRTLSGPNSGLQFLQSPASSGMHLDTTGQLVVSMTSANGSTIATYANAATVNTNTAVPVAVIQGGLGANSGLTSPSQITVNDNNGDLYVADGFAGGVLVFGAVSSDTGTLNISPTRSLLGSNTTLSRGTGTATAVGIALDTTR